MYGQLVETPKVHNRWGAVPASEDEAQVEAYIKCKRLQIAWYM